MIDPATNEPGSRDILYLLDRLEEVLGAGSRLPFTSRTLIDDEECFAIIDQIRLGLPNEIRKARMVNSEREALLDEARARADQILRAADNDARDRVREHYITQQAEARAAEIIAQAQREGTQVRREADEYSYKVLLDLDQRLEGLLETVRNGLHMLERGKEMEDLLADSTDAAPERLSRSWDDA